MSFSDKARELAELEKRIYDMASAGVPLSTAGPREESIVPVIIPVVVAVAAVAVSGFVNPDGLVRIGCWVAAILALGKAYMNWKQRLHMNRNNQDSAKASNQLENMIMKEFELMKELDSMKPAGDKNIYWWETDIGPAEYARWRAQLSELEWDFSIFNEIRIEPKKGGLYCRDFTEGLDFCEKKEAESMISGKDYCELYHDGSAWNGTGEQFICRYLYAFTTDPLEELSQHRNLLFDCVFFPCAVILQSVADGKAASILLPRKMQESIEFTMRADDSKCPTSGYLESYLEFDPLIVGGTRLIPDIKMVADHVFKELKNCGIALNPRNILEKKPEGLTDEEWCYLIWTDH